MSATPPPSLSKALTLTQWLVCATAAVGFAFDTYELLMLPLVVRPALQELIGAKPGSPEFLLWVGRLFFIPAFAGGIFGLWGGWLTDRLGRRRVLTGSIFLYAIGAFVSGYATSVTMLLVCRCLVFIGVCVEFVAAVAWLAEIFDDPKQRESVIGYTQAFASIGGLLVASVNGWIAGLGTAGNLPGLPLQGLATSLFGTIENPDLVWRYTLMSGLFPALPLIFVRPFLPESPKWAQRKAAGNLKRPSILELFSPALKRTTIVSTILVGLCYGAAFGAIQHLPQIVPGLENVKAETEGKPVPAARAIEQKSAAHVTKFQEIGGILGRLLLAFLVAKFASRQKLLWIFVVPALLFIPYAFWSFSSGVNPQLFSIGSFHIYKVDLMMLLAGLLVVGQMSFWGNYLPAAFPLHLRGTGESMAANIGGRMIGTSFAWVTTTIAAQSFLEGVPGPRKFAIVAAGVAAFIFTVAFLTSLALPEPAPEHEE